MSGKLIGVGLGPGDPDLMTLKAAKEIARARVLAYPALPGTTSMARSIAAQHISPDAREITLEIPMTTARGPAQEAYDRGAEAIARALETGEDVVFLCEGDPFFYGSFMYVHARLADRFETEIVPGVSSLNAVAAQTRAPLTARNDVLTVLPGPLPDDVLRARIEDADSLAIMKVGRHLGRIRALIESLGLAEQTRYVERATLPDERQMPLADAPDPAPYFSMILIAKGADPWLKTPS
ncbi:MAG: precorrin-2 C(20)-methyltransferase [Rhodobacterales bacterium]|nr:MAG: precorrin-2 C(20)-methyltransferase [Rhodobacterales bacterium]